MALKKLVAIAVIIGILVAGGLVGWDMFVKPFINQPKTVWTMGITTTGGSLFVTPPAVVIAALYGETDGIPAEAEAYLTVSGPIFETRYPEEGSYSTTGGKIEWRIEVSTWWPNGDYTVTAFGSGGNVLAGGNFSVVGSYDPEI